MSYAATAVLRFVVPRRRWLQFSLRTFLALLTLFGVWLGLHIRSANRQKEAVSSIEAVGAVAYYDFEWNSAKAGFDPKAESWAPKWMLSKLGEDFFHRVVGVTLVARDDKGQRKDDPRFSADVVSRLDALPALKVLSLEGIQFTDDGMERFGRLKRLNFLILWGPSEVTDVGAAHLKSLQSLTSLQLSESQITDESWKTFGQLPRLEQLWLHGNRFTDEGLSYLRNLPKLTHLYVGGGDNKITDRSVPYLAGLRKLETLDIRAKNVTAKGLEGLTALRNLRLLLVDKQAGDLTKLRRAMPNCEIAQP